MEVSTVVSAIDTNPSLKEWNKDKKDKLGLNSTFDYAYAYMENTRAPYFRFVFLVLLRNILECKSRCPLHVDKGA